jgi:hypothetical protein
MTYEGRKVLARILKDHNVYALVNGEATGIDADAKAVAKSLNIEIISYPADWDTYGLKAGPIRNAEMAGKLSNGDGILIVFSGGPGTKDMLKQAIARHIPVINLQDKKYSYEA